MTVACVSKQPMNPNALLEAALRLQFLEAVLAVGKDVRAISVQLGAPAWPAF